MAAPTVTQGNISTADPTSTTIVRNVSKSVAYLDQDNTQFTTMLMRMPDETIDNFKHEWVEDQLLPTNTALAASITNSATVLTVTTGQGTFAQAGDVVRNTLTGEGYLVTAVFTSAWSIIRAFGTTSAVSSASTNANLVIVGNTNEQNAAAPTALITARVMNYNYTSIERNVADFAGTTRIINFYGDKDLIAAEKRKKALEHKWKWERTAFFGARAYTTGTNGKPQTSAGGINEFITTNRTNVNGALDKAAIQDILRNALQYGNRSRKVIFCAPLVGQVLGEFLQDNWVRATSDETVWGVKADYVVSAAWGAKIPVFIKGDWMRYGEGTAGQYGSFGFIVDLDYVCRTPARNNGVSRDTQLRENIQNNDVDGYKFEFLTEASFRFAREEAHAVFYNVSG